MEQETRIKASRIFGWIGLIVMIVWTASYFQKRFPIKMEIHYLYQDVPFPDKLIRVEANIYTLQDRWRSTTRYYHPKGLTEPDRKLRKIQKIELSKTEHKIKVILFYQNAPKRHIEQRIKVKETGRFFVYLKKARTTPPKR